MKTMSTPLPEPTLAFIALLALGVMLAMGIPTLGCNASPGAVDNGTSANKNPVAGGGDPCAAPNQGCACSVPGAAVDCGEVVKKSGNYVSCSMGTRSCSNGVWGSCLSAYATTKALSLTGALRLANLNPSTACSGNPCDPTCTTFVDDPSGIDAGTDSGLTITDGSVSLTGVPVSLMVCNSLQITPNTGPAKDLKVTSMAPSPNTVSYAAALLPASCYPGVPSVLWSTDKFDLAQMNSSGVLTLAVPIAGPMTVTAYAGSLSAAVVCNVTVDVVDATAAPNGYSNAQFPTTTGMPDNISVVYPYPGTVFPLGLPAPLIQWNDNSSPATTASAVKVTLRFPTAGPPMFSWSEIVPELQAAPTPSLPAKPRAIIPQNVWNAYEQTVVRNSGVLGGDALFVVQRYVSGILYAEVPTTIHFANGQLKGNIFYNSYGTNLVRNFGSTVKGGSFGAATLQVPANGTSPTVVVGYNDPTLSGGGCRVCHSASASGTRILSNSYLTFGANGPGSERTSFLYNPTLATPALIQGSETLIGSYGGNQFTYAALSPDGTYLFNSAAPASAGGPSGLYTLSGTPIASNVPPTLEAATPTFATDAKQVAFNFYSGNAKPLSNVNADGKSIAMMDFSPPSTFSNFRNLYTPASALYSVWPSFLPAGQNGIVFANEITGNGRDWAGTRSNCDSSGACNGIGATGDLWWVSTGATPQAARLANLNGGAYMPRLAGGANLHGTSAQNGLYYEEVYNYEPNILPVTIGGYSWVAFTSRRLYGNVATLNPYWSDPRFQDISTQPTTKKIWISAISSNPTPGTDPSFPAFYLPGQELLAGNSRAYFSLSACEAAGPPTPANLCTSNLDCCGATTSPATAVCQLDPPPLGNPPVSHCVATTPSTCVADGANCTSDGQCCNFAGGSRCASGTCQQVPAFNLYSPATFTTKYTANCTSGMRPVWRFLYWKSVTPNGTSITFAARTSTDGVTWGASTNVGTSAPPPNVTSQWTSAPQTVDQALVSAGQRSQPILEVAASLSPSADHSQTPLLTDWQVQYDCVSAE